MNPSFDVFTNDHLLHRKAGTNGMRIFKDGVQLLQVSSSRFYECEVDHDYSNSIDDEIKKIEAPRRTCYANRSRIGIDE